MMLVLLAGLGLPPVSPRAPCPATSTPSSLGIYPVFFAVQGTKSFLCPGCNSSAYARNGSVDVAAFGLLPNNWTYVASWDSIWPTLGGANGSVPVNGGVPQAANLSAHIRATEAAIELRIPKGWAGLGVFDFERWSPLWEDNTAPAGADWHSERYRSYSRELVRAAHPDWSSAQIEARAKAEFEEAALTMFVSTLRAAARLRPAARWGFYGMPAGSFALTPDTYSRAVADARRLQAVWTASGALYPSVYLDAHAATTEAERQYQIAAQIKVTQAARASRLNDSHLSPLPIYPFAWECSSFHNGDALLGMEDLRTELLLPYAAGSDGLVVWGYSGGAEGGPAASSGPQRASYYRHLRNVTAPMLRDFRREALECSRQHCNGHGRCAQVPPAAAGAVCQCFQGVAGSASEMLSDSERQRARE